MSNIVSTPLDIPLIVPNDKSAWEALWNKATPVEKVNSNHNAAAASWIGFDIYVKGDINALDKTGYLSKNVNCPELFPCIFDNLDKFPIEVEIVRAVSSCSSIIPHYDYQQEMVSVRSMLYDDNPKPTFYYYGNPIQFQRLPESTNTWMYWDQRLKHGSLFFKGHSKILLMYYGKQKIETIEQCFKDGEEKFTEFVIYDNV